MRSYRLRTAAALAALVLAGTACDNSDIIIGGGGYTPGAPEDLRAGYAWVLDGFSNGVPFGAPSVRLTWFPPSNWQDEPFRVYGKRSTSASFTLIATVTSCSDDGCAYEDRNVVSGTTYEYYVATVEEISGAETSSEFREVVRVPAYVRPAAPVADSVIGLDDAAFVRWRDGGVGDALDRYHVYLTRVGNQTSLYRAGETDGAGYLDLRATNGSTFGYRIAAVDTLGHVSSLSAEITGTPRPDYTAELIYAFADNAAESGFRFRGDEGANPIVSGSSGSAQWRLESDAGGYRLVPLNGTQIAPFPGRTTALVCGPAADATCRAATTAPATGWTTGSVPLDAEFSYVLRVTGDDGQLHYGVIRVTLLGSDGSGRDLAIFDWAYQLQPNNPRLNVAAAR